MKPTIAIALFILGLSACPDHPAPTITVKFGEVSCKQSDVTITASATATVVAPSPGITYSVAVAVDVKCNGVPVPGASLSAGYWFATVAQATTDANGHATFPAQAVQGALPASPTVNVTVTPTQGAPFVQTVPVTVGP